MEVNSGKNASDGFHINNIQSRRYIKFLLSPLAGPVSLGMHKSEMGRRKCWKTTFIMNGVEQVKLVQICFKNINNLST